MINVVILKFTKNCNADCSFCAAPKEVNGGYKRNIDDWKRFLEKMSPHLAPSATIIWHGGEPMMLGPDFYVQAREIADEMHPGLRFAMQTNLLLYKESVWGEIISRYFGNGVSTSYEPGLKGRTLKGDPIRYASVFLQKLEDFLDNGHSAKVIANLDSEAVENSDHHKLYDMALRYEREIMEHGKGYMDIRLNYRYPAGRAVKLGDEFPTPEQYGEMLVSIYERMLDDACGFNVTPLDEMVQSVLGIDNGRCPFTRACGGKYLGIEPNGDVYTCSEFADIQDPEFCYGNIWEQDPVEILGSRAATDAKRRAYFVPASCTSCEHFLQCQGGCMRDSALYGRGLYGKTQYCAAWKMVYSRIKESIADGSARRMLAAHGLTNNGLAAGGGVQS